MDRGSRRSAARLSFDALLVVSFGGPEGPGDVMPFLERVTRGRGVPEERLQEVAKHYLHFGGVSPINAANRALIDALRLELASTGRSMPIYWGNRNWHPFLEDAVRTMRDDGVKRALAFATSAFGSYSGCRQYLEDIARARAAVGSGAPEIEKLPPYGLRDGFVDAQCERVNDALSALDPAVHAQARLVFTAHSIPTSMAAGSPYESQLRESAARVAARTGHRAWELAWQSRSGPPSVPWLEPDILDVLVRAAAQEPERAIVLVPIGFTSDHVEVLWDLDEVAGAKARELGLTMVRAHTVGAHPRFVAMIRELIEARERAGPALCAPDCCPPPSRSPR
jgi:protoporphyrin/coproporphyrin ferrochelatase